MSILRIDASATHAGSVTRALTDQIVATIGGPVTTRDLAQEPLPQVNDAWVAARAVPSTERTEAQSLVLTQSDSLIAEVMAADTLVIGVPVYNFGIPAALKAWIDLLARAGVTFRYTENGPVGLITGKRVILAVASGGTAADSGIDFATPYMRHVLGFLGLTDVTVIAADALAKDREGTLARAHAQIEALRLAA